MKSKDEMANDHGLGMSRRAILKAASAVAAAGITIRVARGLLARRCNWTNRLWSKA